MFLCTACDSLTKTIRLLIQIIFLIKGRIAITKRVPIMYGNLLNQYPKYYNCFNYASGEQGYLKILRLDYICEIQVLIVPDWPLLPGRRIIRLEIWNRTNHFFIFKNIFNHAVNICQTSFSKHLNDFGFNRFFVSRINHMDSFAIFSETSFKTHIYISVTQFNVSATLNYCV